MDVPTDNYSYSLVTHEDPWVAYTLRTYQYERLSKEDKLKCRYIPDVAAKVYAALQLPNASELLLSSCQRSDVEDWSEDVDNKIKTKDAINGKIISATFNGVEYKTEEHFPYFCHVGATVIAELWRSHDPLAFDVKWKVEWTESLAVEQLKYLHGVFFFELTHSMEGHSFVLWMAEKEITIINTYGAEYNEYYYCQIIHC
jgi:hypothetical protein